MDGYILSSSKHTSVINSSLLLLSIIHPLIEQAKADCKQWLAGVNQFVEWFQGCRKFNAEQAGVQVSLDAIPTAAKFSELWYTSPQFS